MTSQTKIRVANREQLGIDRPVRVVAGGAAFAQSRMLKDERTGLLAMARGTRLVLARHGQATRRLHDVQPMRIVALHTIHFPFGHRMMFRKMKLCVDLQMALIATLRIPSWIED